MIILKKKSTSLRAKTKKIVGRSESGKIAIISYDYKGLLVKDGEDWICAVTKNEEKKLIIVPLELIRTSLCNHSEAIEKLKELKEKGFKKQFTKPKNARLYYQSK